MCVLFGKCIFIVFFWVQLRNFINKKRTAFTALSMFYFRHLFILSVFLFAFFSVLQWFLFLRLFKFYFAGFESSKCKLIYIFFLVWWLHFLLIRQWFYDISFRFWVYNYILPLEYSSLTIHIHTYIYLWYITFLDIKRFSCFFWMQKGLWRVAILFLVKNRKKIN